MMQKKTPEELLQQAKEALSAKQYEIFKTEYLAQQAQKQAHSIETRV